MIDLKKYHDSVTFEGLDYHVTELDRCVEQYRLDLDPDYQRGHIWTLQQQQRFVGHILEGGRTQRLLINSENRYSEPFEFTILDGKQRLTSLLMWIHGEIAAEFSDGVICWRDKISAESAWVMRRITVPFGLTYLKRPELLKLYIRLNRGGTVHTEDEISHVRALLESEVSP